MAFLLSLISLILTSITFTMVNDVKKNLKSYGDGTFKGGGILLSSNLNLKNDTIDENFEYLAIGNSITIHGKCSYWYGEWGMAATEADKDYFHLVAKGISKYASISATAINFADWEVASNDRAQVLKLLDPYLNKNLDLITVQLGENVSEESSSFDNDFNDLVKYIKCFSLNAKIIIIGDYWNSDSRETEKQNCADTFGYPFVSLVPIRGTEFQCGIGTQVYGDDNNLHIVEHAGVAAHPGNSAMKFYAEQILNCLDL